MRQHMQHGMFLVKNNLFWSKYGPGHSITRFPQLLSEVEMHFIIHILALWVKTLEDLCQHIDGLLTAQACALGLELLQQVLRGHWFTDQVASYCVFC